MGNNDYPPVAAPELIERQAADFVRAEQNVETHSANFKKELGLTDLVLAQILIVVTYNFIGTAGKLGSDHLFYWIIAIGVFYIPLAAVVSYLNRLMPLEGGIYQWAKLGFNNFMGFFVAWNMWLYVIVYLSSIGLEISTYLSYALPNASWIAGNKVFITALNCSIIGMLVFSAIVGLNIGKFVYNFGAAFSIGVFVLLIALPLINIAFGNRVTYTPLHVTIPAVSLFSLNILTKMAFGGLCGFEHVAVFAGESKNPKRSIGRSVAIAAPIIALMYILGTSSVLAFNTPDAINLIGPLPQALQAGFSTLVAYASWMGYVAPALILLLAFSQAAYGSILLAGMARLPMVIGWDALLPEWFTKLHPKYQTPINSVIFVGIVTLVVGLVSILGVGEQEAFQLLVSGSFIFYAIMYLVMFAIPLIGLKRSNLSAAQRPSPWLRLAATSGVVVSIGFIVLSLFPIVDVNNPLIFGLKILAVIVVANGLGVLTYLIAKKRAE